MTVDHLRALAAVLIMFYHGSQLFSFYLRTGVEGFYPDPWPKALGPIDALIIEGHSAVSLFMVLSGFIFTHGNWQRDVAYRQFLVNRVWRIYPLFLFMSMYGWLLYPAQFTLLGAVQSLLPLSGVPGAIENDLTTIGWAVRVEFQFYLLFPFLHRFSQRLGVRYLLGVIALFVLLRGWASLQTGSIQPLAYWTLLGRMDQFVIGMLLAHIHHCSRLTPRLRSLLVVPAVAALLGWEYWFNHSGGWPVNDRNRILWPLAEGLAYAGVIYSYLGLEDVRGFRDSLPARLLARVGEMSFSIYLLHLLIAKTLVHSNWLYHFHTGPARGALLNTLFVFLPVTLAMSALSFNLIERPFFQFRKSHRPTS